MQPFLNNFALILFVLMIVSGIVWFIEICFLKKQRQAKAIIALAKFDSDEMKFNKKDTDIIKSARSILKANLLRRPIWIEYSGGLFPMIALVFCFRSFLYEPFKIPSSSMLPTLLIGDLILVNKFTYGIRFPIINKKIISINNPKRGDVVVFKYPKNTSENYIKRVIGIPGDKIIYKNKRLTINTKKISYQVLSDYLDNSNSIFYKQWKEKLDNIWHKLLIDERTPDFILNFEEFPHHQLCTYNFEGFMCTVPKGQYFVMGDNRDNSLDSRYWGFVPDQNIVGKAFFIWMNFNNIRRIGNFIQ